MTVQEQKAIFVASHKGLTCCTPHTQELDVSFNSLTRLPASIAYLRRLHTLRCVGNKIKELPRTTGTV